MKFKQLGSSDLNISDICLGTMTFGRQNNQQEANEQMDFAVDYGINFMDTAEMYATPANKSTYGSTEKIIGNWLTANPEKREKVVLMTKIAGPGMSYVRNGDKILGKYIEQSVDDSLKRLQTDYIDVYQLHWPNRRMPHFGRHWLDKVDFSKTNSAQEEEEMLGILQALDACIKKGKIRHCGLSDDTPWGIEKYIHLAKTHNLPKMVSIQNEFNLLDTKDWPFVIESCVANDVAYLPWSPLGGGVLSGKYLGGQRPEGSRWSLTNGSFRDTDLSNKAVAAYVEIAKKYDMTPSQLSLAWCKQFNWVTSTIIGATSMAQLKENVAAFELELSREALKEINEVKQQYAIPYK